MLSRVNRIFLIEDKLNRFIVNWSIAYLIKCKNYGYLTKKFAPVIKKRCLVSLFLLLKVFLIHKAMSSHDHPGLSSHEIFHVHDHDETCNLVKKALDKFTARYDHGWYAPAPGPVYSPPALSSMDPMQVLATLAFVAFLLQNLMALIDRLSMATRVTRAREDKKNDKAHEVVNAIRKFQNKWDEKNK